METVKALHAYFCLLLACGVLSLTVSASVHPGAREDVMGQYRLTNRQQCRRLCWYRALCGSYSYHTESSASLMDMSTSPPNCVLHTQLDGENCLCSAHATCPCFTLSVFSLHRSHRYPSPVVLAYPSLHTAPPTPPVLQFIFPTTFSSCYIFIDHILSSPPLTCDVPPGGARDDHTTRAGGWQETSASSSHINNGCKARPCSNTDVCVPTLSMSMSTSSTSVLTSPTSVATSSTSASYVCMPLPSHCADPDPVSHGDVVVIGNSQDDVAHVTCDVGYVAAPRNVSTELVCLVSQCVYVVSRCVCMVSRCVCTESVCLVSQYVCIVSQSVW